MNENLKFLTINQFCQQLNVSKVMVYRMLKIKSLKGIRISEGPKAGWRIPITELQRFHAMAYQNIKEENKNE